MIVLDANILIRGVMGSRAIQIIETYAARGVRFCAPDAVFAETGKHLPLILSARSRTDVSVETSLRYLASLMQLVPHDSYKSLEATARRRLRGRDENDWPVLACVLRLNCPL